MSALGDKARFKQRLDEIGTAFRASLTAGLPAYAGAEIEEPLEHATRRHVIDFMLGALGWHMDAHAYDILEEAQARGETTLFLDYLGVNPNSRMPLVVVEAKAWALPFISARTADNRPLAPSLIAQVIDHLKAGGSEGASPATIEWTRWIAKLRTYVNTVSQTSGGSPKRVVITSGQWLVVFTHPQVTFLDNGTASDRHIRCFVGPQLIECSDEIFDHLARSVLIGDPPERLRSAQIGAYVAAGEVAHLFCGLWLVHKEDGAHFDIQPSLTAYAAVIIQRKDGVVVTVVDQENRVVLPHDMAQLRGYLDAVAAGAERLRGAVNAELNATLVPSAVESFAGFGGPSGLPLAPDVSVRPAGHNKALVKQSSRHPREFLLVTGLHPHFLNLRATVTGCAFHDWSACRAANQHQGEVPIVSRSVEPRSFFCSTEEHHCAHQVIHGRRDSRCQIDAFEEFLCCRACTLQSFCWHPEELNQLPCTPAI